MAPTPISLLDNALNSQNAYRSWDPPPIDFQPKTMAGHLPLGKRNSTPVGVGLGIRDHLKLSMAQQVQLANASQVANQAPEVQNTHKTLDRCHSEPSSAQLHPTMSSRYKTELCRPFQETGFCKYGEKCQFAHGDREMRNLQRHPKYKTELCRTFHTTGLCGYGTRCHFIHNAEERRGHEPSSPGHQNLTPPLQNLSPSLHNMSPPNSLHGSPTAPAGAFFGEAFITPTNVMYPEDSPFALLTPPVSPVESLAGDIENLSLSPALSDSPVPQGLHANLSAILDAQRYIRLPIFESLKEGM